MRGIDDKQVTSAGKVGRQSREYTPPKLTQWGNIHTLTQGGTGLFIDLPAPSTRAFT